ncbi:MAG: PilZ domain-containing protein [Pseudomonadota bacterium]
MADVSDHTNRPPRARALKQGFAGWSELQSAIECTVRDISDGGARLQFADTAVLPPTFELSIPIDGTITPCEVVWMKSGMVGVKFIGLKRHSKSRRRDQVLTAYRVDENRLSARSASSDAAVMAPKPIEPASVPPPEPDPESSLYRPRPKKVAFGRRGYEADY